MAMKEFSQFLDRRLLVYHMMMDMRSAAPQLTDVLLITFLICQSITNLFRATLAVAQKQGPYFLFECSPNFWGPCFLD